MVEFLFLVARDNFKLKKRQKIDLKKLYVCLKSSKEFKVNGDRSIEIETFNTMTIGFLENSYFALSYKGVIYYKKVVSFDFFLNANEFKKKFFEEYVKQCLIIEPKKVYKSKSKV